MNELLKSILVVRTDRIGDVILTTPAIKALRDAYPKAKITVLVTPQTKELVEGNICIDEVLVDDRNKEHKGLIGYIKLIKLLRQKKFDLAIIYHTKKRTNLMCYLSGIPTRIGYKNNKFGFLLNCPISDTRHTGDKHEAQYCLDVLKSINIHSEDLKLYLPVGEEALQWVEQFRYAHNIKNGDCLIAIHSGASDPAKRWPNYLFAELIDTLIDRYKCKIVLIGSLDVKDDAKEIINAAKSDCIDLTGKTTVGQMAGLLTRCDLLVSSDSGPVHIAAGVGTPVVSIFTRNQPGINPERWRPLGERSKVVSVSSSQSSGISFQKAQIMDPKYMELIATDEVLEAVDSLFKLC